MFVTSPDAPLPRPEPHLTEIAHACQTVYGDAHIEHGVMDVEVRFDELSEPSELLVTFRGSESVRDWLVNMCAMMVYYDECMIHAGFLASWCSVDLQVIDAIDKIMNRTGMNDIVVAGHSLGGAMASLCALDLKRVRPQYNVRLTTFAGPKVGNAAFAKQLVVLKPLTICHFGDVVPKLPVFSVLARSIYRPSKRSVYAAPKHCKHFIARHHMSSYIETVDEITRAHGLDPRVVDEGESSHREQ